MRSRRTWGHRAAGSTGRGDGQRVRRGGDVKRDSPAAAEGHPAANTPRAPSERAPTPSLPHLLVAPARSILPPFSLRSPRPGPPSSPPDATPGGEPAPSRAATPPDEPARCSRGPPSSPSTPGANAGRSLRPPSRPGLSSPHPSGQGPLRGPPRPGARRPSHSPGRRPRPSSRARVSPPRLLQPPPAPPSRHPAPAGRPGFLLLRFAVTLNPLSSIELLACHSKKGGPNCRRGGSAGMSPPHWRRPLKETSFLPTQPRHPLRVLWGQKERDFAADPRGGLFSFKLFFWHTPGVKEKAWVPCDNSEILRAELSSGGTQPHAQRACNAHSTVG